MMSARGSSAIAEDKNKTNQAIAQEMIVAVEQSWPNEKITTELQGLDRVLEHLCTISQFRFVIAPNQALKARQRTMLSFLERIPQHAAAHGFIRGRDPFSCAMAHLAYWGRQPRGLVLLNVDLKNFFHCVSGAQVSNALEKHNLQRRGDQTPSNYASRPKIEDVLEVCALEADADLAAKVAVALFWTAHRACSSTVGFNAEQANRIEHFIRESVNSNNSAIQNLGWQILSKLGCVGTSVGSSGSFMPQGAPTSPVLSNLVCKIIDIRLAAMAKAFGAHYTRYADDLTFSWPAFTKGKVIDGMKRCSEQVVQEYGFVFNKNKIRVMGTGTAQDVVGYVINSGRPTITQKYRRTITGDIKRYAARREGVPFFDKMKLEGKISYISLAHPTEARKCREDLEYASRLTSRRVSSSVTENNSGSEVEHPEEDRRRAVAIGDIQIEDL